MGFFLSFCLCRSSPRKRNSTTTNTRPTSLQQHPYYGSIDQSIDESHPDEDDIRAVKSWREKKRIQLPPPPLPPIPNHAKTSTALVVFDHNSNRKLSTIEEDTNASRNTSVSVSPSQLPPSSPSMMIEDLISTIAPLPVSPVVMTSDNTPSRNHHPKEQHQTVDFTDPHAVLEDLAHNLHFHRRSASVAHEIYVDDDDDDDDGGPPQYSNRHRNLTQRNYYDGDSGGFPSLSPKEEKFRKEQRDYLLSQERQQDDFVSSSSSSSSNSTIEDPILLRTSIDNDDTEDVGVMDRRNQEEDRKRTASGPIDLDDDDIIDPIENTNNLGSNHTYNQIDKHEVNMSMVSSSFLSSTSSTKQRPGPDDTDIDRPVALENNHYRHHTNISTSSSFSVSSSANTDKRVREQRQQEKSQISSSLILDDKEPELYTINNSAESEELDAMIAAIDSNESDNKTPPLSLPSTTKDAISRSTMIRSSRNSQSSPTIHLSASQQSSPSLHSGSRNSVPTIKLSPSPRDSPSVLDPTSYIMSPHEYIGNDNIDIELGVNHNASVLVLSSNDGSASIGSPIRAVVNTTKAITESRRGRSTTAPRGRQEHFNVAASNMGVVKIPETVQQRRKARSQSRGRRIRDRARTLLLSYNGGSSKTAFNDRATSEEQGNIALFSAPTTIIQPITMENGSDVTGLSTTQIDTENEHKSLPLLRDARCSNNPIYEIPGLTTTRSLHNGSSMTNLLIDRSLNDSLRPPETDHSDRLSDIPSEVDPMLRERYLKACRILKSSLLEKDATIRPSDKAFLSQLLLETTPSKEDDDDGNDLLTEDKVKLYESSVHNTLLERSIPLFDTATTVVTTTDDFSRTTIVDAAASVTNGLSSSNTADIYTVNPNVSGESSFVTEQELQMHNYFMNNHYSTATNSSRVNGGQINTATTASNVSSSTFSRVDDDYPYKVVGLDSILRPKVLLPCMMNALRGFLPLEISNHNFWIKYQLDRDTDINHAQNNNLMALLSKVRRDTYSILCVETIDGYVFGAFCSAPWKIQSNWYGTGASSFLWRLKQPRRGRTNDKGLTGKTDDGKMNEIEIYPYTRYDAYVQYCSSQTLAVGGGTDWTLTKEGYSPYHRPSSGDASLPSNDEPMATGIGFLLDGDLMGGETNSCVTYANPRLGNNSDGTHEFNIQTLEVYTFTKISTMQEAEMKE